MQTEVAGDGNLFLMPSRRFIPIGRHFDTSYSGSAPSPLVSLREQYRWNAYPPPVRHSRCPGSFGAQVPISFHAASISQSNWCAPAAYMPVVLKAAQAAIVNAVNPRLNSYTNAAFIAICVLIANIGAVFGMAALLNTRCSEVGDGGAINAGCPWGALKPPVVHTGHVWLDFRPASRARRHGHD